MNAVLERRRFTVAEFVQLGEMGILRPGEHVELIAGEIVMMSPERLAMSPQGPVHSGVAAVLSEKLAGHFRPGQFCIRLHSPFQASDVDLPEPDVAVLPGRCEEFIDTFPDKAVLIVEVVVSSHAYDRGVKANLYAQAGVLEYWVLDVPGRRMEAFREPSDHGYRTVRFLTEEDRILPVAATSDSTEGLAISDLLPPVRAAAPLESHG